MERPEVYDLVQLARQFGDTTVQLTWTEYQELCSWYNVETLSTVDGVLITIGGTNPVHEMIQDLIAKTIAQQQAKVKAYDIIVAKGLPIPEDLKELDDGI